MTDCTALWINRKDITKTKQVTFQVGSLADGQILVAIDKFGLTANNVSYAVTGDSIGYWQFYPAEGIWGIVPVWGCATVTASKCGDIPVGDRLWGYFPMASHAVLTPGNIRADYFIDIVEHRSQLPIVYNQFRRTQAEPEFLQRMENERCLLFPLFMTSYLIYDYLIDNDFFGAQQVVIGSVSSKTGFGLAQMLRNDKQVSQSIIGVTSPRNVEFVKNLGCCDQIVLYQNEAQIDPLLPTAYIDMSGDARLTINLHNHVGENIVESCMVGASHWQEGGKVGDLPGARPRFFFAPGQIEKRNKEWGPGVAMARAMAASAEVAERVAADINIEWVYGADSLADHWARLLDNQIAPSQGLMVVL
ncbi:MAG: DUF2855 family protein [Porticoccaceae bacterium]|nr:DUF2855 family protein [Porticoccaceae bacterium]MDG1307087.1 DUF2855 family protein [Porticoccaceae bacterium]